MSGTSIERADGVKLAYEFMPGNGPVVVFLPGFASDMGGTKAMELRALCGGRGQAMLRLDYSGHGESGGRFEDGSIGEWAEDAFAVISAAAGDTPLILVGSSMGGWIALLLALRLKPRVTAMMLIAPAPDFSSRVLAGLSPQQREILDREGFLLPPSDYGPPVPFTKKLLDEGEKHLLLGGRIGIDCPVHVLHGMQDRDVPWRHSLKLAECLESPDVRLIFVKDGDHRLSREEDLLLLRQTLGFFLSEDRA